MRAGLINDLLVICPMGWHPKFLLKFCRTIWFAYQLVETRKGNIDFHIDGVVVKILRNL